MWLKEAKERFLKFPTIENERKATFMEGKRRKKIVVLFISTLIIFSIFTFYLAQQYPRKIRGIYFYLDNGRNELDHLNLSDVQSTLNNVGYFLNITNDLPYQFSGEGLEIIPINNSDVVIYLIKDKFDIYFYGWMEYEVRFPGGYGDIGIAEKTLQNEMERILSLIELESLQNDIRFGDNDFIIMFEAINGIIFFFLLSVELIFAILILYQKGLLIDKIFEQFLAGSELKGIILLFIGLFLFLFMLYELINSIMANNMRTTIYTALCTSISIIFISIGYYILFSMRKRTLQNQD